MVDIVFERKNYGPIPENYNELSGTQLLAIAEVFLQKPEPVEAALMVLRILLQMGFVKFHLLAPDFKERMIPHITWVFEDKNSLTAQLIPRYKGLYGPAGEFDNLTMAEWNACETFYAQMLHGDEEALNCLVAVLYRPRRWLTKADNGDIRKPFEQHMVAHRAELVAEWPENVKYAILLWFDGCRQLLQSTYDVFDTPTEGGENEPGMFEVIRNLAGQRYGSFKDVEGMDVHMAMREMELCKKEAKQMEKQLTAG